MQNYKKYVFGNKNRVYLYLLDYPIENGVLGFIKCKLFEKNIGICIQQNEQSKETRYSFGGMYISSYQQQPIIEMSKDLCEKEKLGLGFLTTIFHELGHYYYGDLNNPESSNDELRMLAVKKSTVLYNEKRADEFSVKYLGKKRTLLGLAEIINKINFNADLSDETTEFAIRELDMRIQTVKNKRFTIHGLNLEKSF